MEQYGEFIESVNRLDGNLATVRAIWTDQTAITYDTINDNVKMFILQITANFENSKAGYNAVKENYNESQFENKLDRLNAKVAAV